ncbi:hypothetical protein GGF46_005422 [Coemansia sp. RSA 552]|nr:hypothetical protein GGF46_005422 [Coemansia sp. RSA 552]
MAVDTRQARDEYEKTAEYVRKLCEGEDIEGLAALLPEKGSSAAAATANGSGRPKGSERQQQARLTNGDSRSAATPTAPQTPHSVDAKERTPTRARTRQNGSSTPGSSSSVARPTTRGQVNGTAGSGREGHDTCDACRQPGEFICCEHCPRVYHFLCVDPPMTREKVSAIDHWYCRECAHALSRKRKSRAHAKNIFYPLISQMEYSNPRAFTIPEEIRRLFDGVEANADGSYTNTRENRPQRAHMGPTNRDFTRLTDDHNEPIMCYRCRLSALHGLVVRCDYCPLSWHWDCLDPPLSSAPPPHRKWMCPNHAEHAMTRHHRKFRKERIVDQTNAPEDARNSGIVDIVDDDPPWHEICDPKVRYRTTSTRIREQFARNARPCVVTVSEDCTSQSEVDPQPEHCADDGPGTNTSSALTQQPYQASQTVSEWLQSIVAFQQDVARFIMDSTSPTLAATPGDTLVADHNSKFAALSSVAAQILAPPVQPAAPPASDDGDADGDDDDDDDDDTQVAVSALAELPRSHDTGSAEPRDVEPSRARLSRDQFLSENQLTSGDLEAALESILIDSSRSDEPVATTATGGTKRRQTLDDSQDAKNTSPVKRLRLLTNVTAEDRARLAGRARTRRASALVKGLLRNKSSGELLDFLLGG